MKKLFPPIIIWIYLFFLIGLVFHTSIGKEQVLHKYSNSYFAIILFLFVIFIPFVLFIKSLINKTEFKIKKKKIILTPNKKIFIFLISITILFLLGEIFLRSQKNYVRKTVYDKEFHPFLQSKMKKNLGDNYHTNSYGFRGEEIKKVKDTNTYRIILMGGSTVYGDGISYEYTSAKILGDLLTKKYSQKIEVINAGVSGYNSEHTLIDYMTRISDFKPDLVIMWSGVNDMFASCSNPDFFSGSYQSDYSHFLGPISRMVNSYFRPQIIQLNLFTINYLHTYLYSDFQKYIDIISKKQSDNYRASIPYKDLDFPSIKSYERNLEYFVNAVKSDNAKLILGNQSNIFAANLKNNKNLDGIFCLDGNYKATLKSQTKGMEEFNKVTKNIASKNDLPFIDFNSAIPKTSDYFYDEIHWTDKGHRMAAMKLYEFIINGNIIPN